MADLQLNGLSTACNPTTLANCVPFSDMDANYSNGSSVYHGLTANLRKRFNHHYEMLASYTWSPRHRRLYRLAIAFGPPGQLLSGARALEFVV